MKKLNNFIQEKLNLNSNNIVNNDKIKLDNTIKSILKHFFIDEENDMANCIRDWVNKYKITEVFYYANWEVIDQARESGISEKILKDFRTDSELIMYCLDEIDNCKKIFNDEIFDIYANDKIIGYLAPDGGVYATKDKIIIKKH